MSDVYLPLQASNSNLHRSKLRTTCCETPSKISPKSDGYEVGNAVLRKLRRPKKSVAPSGMKLALGGS